MEVILLHYGIILHYGSKYYRTFDSKPTLTKAWFTLVRIGDGRCDRVDSIPLHKQSMNLMFFLYFSLFNIYSHTPERENPRFLRQV